MPATRKHSTQFSLPTDLELVMTRQFDAPPSVVFEAWTKPDLVKRWWGPPGSSVPVCDIDLRVGGAWRQVLLTSSGAEVELCGVYREVVPDARLVTTQVVHGCGAQGADESLVTMLFVRSGAGTVMTHTTRFVSKAIRDSVANSGARTIDHVYDRLDALLASGQLCFTQHSQAQGHR